LVGKRYKFFDLFKSKFQSPPVPTCLKELEIKFVNSLVVEKNILVMKNKNQFV
jgi:hypothetical protein